MIEQYQLQIDKRNINVQIKYKGSDIIIANRTIIEILFSNFISNAIRFNLENGSINVLIEDNIFSLKTPYFNISLDPAKIFERFHKESTYI